jgi:hypothetical protein
MIESELFEELFDDASLINEKESSMGKVLEL